MKKIVLSLLVFTSYISANAQSYVGFYQDNYAGVQSVLFNPSSIVDSRFKTDINLFSVSASAGNDIYGVNFLDAFKTGYDFETQANKTFSLSNNFVMNTDVMGPSFMFNIAPKHSIAIYTRARAFVNVLNVNGNVVDELANTTSSTYNLNLGSPNAVGNSWGELGVSYAAVLYQNGVHFLKGGVTAKYLQGVANYHLQANNVTINYNENILLPQNSSYTTTGKATFGTSQDFATDSDINIDSKSRGLGLDLGLTYEWRPDYDASRADINALKNVNKYKLRIGLSLTDLGSMSYDKGVRNSYNLNNTITQDDFDNADNLDEFFKDNYAATPLTGKVKSYLPTALHADIDWNIHNKFYLNLNGDVSAVDKEKISQSSVANRVSLTPRYESKWFSFYVPISYFEYSNQTQVGVGLRTGVFFIGSGSIVSNAISNNSRAADFHLGVKIPFFQKKAKEIVAPAPAPEVKVEVVDTDKDGVADNDDKCPTVAGPKENNGCPWLDTDKDGVLDKDDKCPAVAGPKENAGCPWADTDGDGVADKDDKCPNVKGTVANQGCPEVSKEVIKKLNDFSKAIMFDSGKSTIRPQSTEKLTAILAVMNEYNASTFQLNGYTDNTGVAAKNLELSKERAAAVKNYLVSNGIAADRLTSEGFGIENPIATNKTADGRALNRRVEIILVK